MVNLLETKDNELKLNCERLDKVKRKQKSASALIKKIDFLKISFRLRALTISRRFAISLHQQPSFAYK